MTCFVFIYIPLFTLAPWHPRHDQYQDADVNHRYNIYRRRGPRRPLQTSSSIAADIVVSLSAATAASHHLHRGGQPFFS